MADAEYTALARELRVNLELLKRNLELAHAGVVVAAGALNYQRADRDPDVADVLERFVGNCIYQQIERTETLLEFINPGAAKRAEPGFDALEALQ
jgi:hypothetical protein